LLKPDRRKAPPLLLARMPSSGKGAKPKELTSAPPSHKSTLSYSAAFVIEAGHGPQPHAQYSKGRLDAGAPASLPRRARPLRAYARA
jgi:hypothetical protein